MLHADDNSQHGFWQCRCGTTVPFISTRLFMPSSEPPIVARRMFGLVIEDEPNVAAVLVQCLSDVEVDARVARSAEEANLAIAERIPDVVLLDLRLPGMPGDRWLQSFRKEHPHPIVIAVSGVGDIERRIALLTNGADDFVSKPFNIRELTARMGSHIRRMQGLPDQMVCAGGLTLDPSKHVIRVNDVGVRLTATEFQIVWRLGISFGEWMDAAMLSNLALGGTSPAHLDDLRVHISNIRSKIRLFEPTVALQSKRRAGYRLVLAGLVLLTLALA